MSDITLLFIASLLLSTFVSLVSTIFTHQIFLKKNWVEDPIQKQAKTKNATALYPVPRGGGIPIFLGVLVASLVLLPVDKHLIGILLAALLALIIGLWDDLKDISPKLRLITNIITALIVVASGIGISVLSNPLGGVIDLSFLQYHFNVFGYSFSIWFLSDLLAVLWIVWCMNIVGWSAGVEGQLPGFVSISAIFLGILGLRFASDITQWPVIILAGAVSGAYLGFLPFNIFPQKIMPGYSGKSLAGFFLSVLAILSGAKLATLVFLLGIPMLDAAFVIIKRLIDHRPIYVSDGQHLHHTLLKQGWSRQNIAYFYWLITLVLGIISLFLNSQQKLYVFLGLVLLFFGFSIQLSRHKHR